MDIRADIHWNHGFFMDIHPIYGYPYPHNFTISVDIHWSMDINPTPWISMRICINKILWITMNLWISIIRMDIHPMYGYPCGPVLTNSMDNHEPMDIHHSNGYPSYVWISMRTCINKFYGQPCMYGYPSWVWISMRTCQEILLTTTSLWITILATGIHLLTEGRNFYGYPWFHVYSSPWWISVLRLNSR